MSNITDMQFNASHAFTYSHTFHKSIGHSNNAVELLQGQNHNIKQYHNVKQYPIHIGTCCPQ